MERLWDITRDFHLEYQTGKSLVSMSEIELMDEMLELQKLTATQLVDQLDSPWGNRKVSSLVVLMESEMVLAMM